MVLVIKRLLFLLALVALSACSPKYDWREVTTANGHVKAIFPDKPRSESRDIEFDGEKHKFTMEMALVDDQVFALVYSVLPEGQRDEANTRKTGEALMRSVYRSMNQAVPEPLPAFGEKLVFRKAVGSENASIYVKVFASGGVVVQAYAAGQDTGLAEPVADEFLNGLQVQ